MASSLSNKIDIPKCPRCNQSTYMIRRSSQLNISKKQSEWMCVVCTQNDLRISGFTKLCHWDIESEWQSERDHLEGKTEQFTFEGKILRLNPETRRYNVVSK